MRTILAIIILFTCIVASAQFPYHPLPFKQADFKKVKERGYTVLNIYVINGDERSLATVVEYGKNGLMATMFDKGVNDNGDTINKAETSYMFDAKGRMVREVINDHESGNGEEITAYTYDASGKLVKKQTASIDPPTYKYKYDAAGKLNEVYVTQKMAVHDEDGEFHGKTFDKPANRYVYKYDAKGRMTEEWDFQLLFGNKSTTPDYKTLWTYNTRGLVSKVKRINSEGSEMYTETYEYNDDGLLKARTYTNGDEIVHYAYDYCKGCKQSWMQADGQ
jgi:hypothetical protein